MRPNDIVLPEDGKPRDLTIFDGPATFGRMPPELALLFDSNPKIPNIRDLVDVFRFIPRWDDSMSSQVLAMENADLRISVISAQPRDGQSTATLGRLPPHTHAPTACGQGEKRRLPFVSAESRGWPMEAALGVLNEAAAAQDKVSLMLVMLSEGIGVTTRIPENAGNQALDLGIPIYPIVTNYKKHIRSWNLPRNHFRMQQFAALGKMTGGRSMDAPEVDAATFHKILETVKNDALSQYVVGFVPSSGDGAPKAHRLDIKLTSKSGRELEGGMRRATY